MCVCSVSVYMHVMCVCHSRTVFRVHVVMCNIWILFRCCMQMHATRTCMYAGCVTPQCNAFICVSLYACVMHVCYVCSACVCTVLHAFLSGFEVGHVTNSCAHACTHACMHPNTRPHTPTRICIYIYIYIYTPIHIHVCVMRVCM